MKKLICVLCLLCFSFFGYSQLETYDLSTYVQPDFYRKNTSINPRVSLFRYKQSYFTYSDEEQTILNRDIELNYNLFISKYNQKTQSTLRISQAPEFSYSKNYSKYKTGNYTSFINYDKKYFLNPQAFFLGFEIDHYARVSKSSTEVIEDFTFESDNNQVSKITSNQVLFKIGKGRIENVDFAWHAIQILNTICANSKVTSADISHQQIIALADKLGDLKNIRIPDPRLENNQEIEVLFNHLERVHLIEKDNYHLITKVLDAFQYESFLTRRKGNDWFIALGANIDYYDLQIDYLENPMDDVIDFAQKDAALGPLLQLGFSYYKPISHQWQLDLTNTIRGSRIKFKEFLHFGNPNNPAIDEMSTIRAVEYSTILNLFYLLNRRTNLSIEIGTFLNYEKNTLEDISSSEVIHRNTTSLGFNYYFSPRHTLDVSFGINYDKGYLQNESRVTDSFVHVNTNYYFH